MSAVNTIDDDQRAAAAGAMGTLGDYAVRQETASVTTRDTTT